MALDPSLLQEILIKAITKKGSDVYIVPGSPIMMKADGLLTPLTEEKINANDCEGLLKEIYRMSDERCIEGFLKNGDDDFSFSLKEIARFRCSAYKQRGTLACVLRTVPFGLPDPEDLHIPYTVLSLYNRMRGMILVTGPAGSGKTTTLACLVDKINRERGGHIITIEDPIEYLHRHQRSVVSQRELSLDTVGYEQALRAALRQAPDVILLGEMRDYETIRTAITAAETGHLLLSSLHTVGAAKTIDRIIDVFPANQQQQVRVQLSMTLQAVVSQQLVPTLSGGQEPAFEIMIVNTAIQNMIREGKVHQMDNAIYAGGQEGMITMDADLLRLYRDKKISRDTALLFSSHPETLEKKLT